VENFSNKNIKIIYNDLNRVVTKEGLFINSDDNFVFIKNFSGNTEAISIDKIIRMEALQ